MHGAAFSGQSEVYAFEHGVYPRIDEHFGQLVLSSKELNQFRR